MAWLRKRAASSKERAYDAAAEFNAYRITGEAEATPDYSESDTLYELAQAIEAGDPWESQGSPAASVGPPKGAPE